MIYHALGSEISPNISSALELMGAIAGLGAGAARELAIAIDFSVPAFHNLAKPSRYLIARIKCISYFNLRVNTASVMRGCEYIRYGMTCVDFG